MYSNWLVVAMTVQRLVAVVFPLKVAFVTSIKKSMLVVAGIGVLTASLNAHLIPQFYYDTVTQLCATHSHFRTYYNTIFPWTNWLMYALLPCSAPVVLNTVIIVASKRAGRVKKRMTQHKRRTNQEQQQTQMTMMLMAVSINMIVCTTPMAVIIIALKSGWDRFTDVPTYMLYFSILTLGRICRALNHAMNFYLYFISGRKFRQQCLNLICFCRRRPAMVNSRTMSRMSTSTTAITRHAESQERASENGVDTAAITRHAGSQERASENGVDNAAITRNAGSQERAGENGVAAFDTHMW
jgi:hypothetical protein